MPLNDIFFVTVRKGSLHNEMNENGGSLSQVSVNFFLKSGKFGSTMRDHLVVELNKSTFLMRVMTVTLLQYKKYIFSGFALAIPRRLWNWRRHSFWEGNLTETTKQLISWEIWQCLFSRAPKVYLNGYKVPEGSVQTGISSKTQHDSTFIKTRKKSTQIEHVNSGKGARPSRALDSSWTHWLMPQLVTL